MTENNDKKSVIINGYIDYVLENGKALESVYAFCKKLKIEEKDFYEHFGSFEGLDGEIWKDFFRQTIEKLKAESVYEEYSAREKLLAFYFALIEVLKTRRSYAVYAMSKNHFPGPLNPVLKPIKEHFTEYIKEIIHKAVSNGEIEDRRMLTDKYYLGFWPQFVFVVNFWVKDDSAKFEKTDAAIEKAVNLSFELLARNPLDSLLDFGKFVFQAKTGKNERTR